MQLKYDFLKFVAKSLQITKWLSNSLEELGNALSNATIAKPVHNFLYYLLIIIFPI